MYMSHVAPWQAGQPGTFGGMTKLDMWAEDEDSAVVGQLQFPAGYSGGEPYFVPDSSPTAGQALILLYRPLESVTILFVYHRAAHP